VKPNYMGNIGMESWWSFNSRWVFWNIELS